MAERFELEGLLRSTGEWGHLHTGVWDDTVPGLVKAISEAQLGTTTIETDGRIVVVRREDFAAFRLKRHGR